MILLPTRGRRGWLEKFFGAYKGTGAREIGVLLVDNDDLETYRGIELPGGWGIHSAERGSIGSRLNLAVGRFPDEDVYMLGSDDLEPRTEGWDYRLRTHALVHGVAWGDDLYKQRCTVPWVSGDWVRRVGWFAPPGLRHLYVDTFWGDVSEAIGGDGFVPGVEVKHHWDIDDETHKARGPDERFADHSGYQQFKQTKNNGFAAAVQRIRDSYIRTEEVA